MLSQRQHTLQRNPCPISRFLVHFHLVDDLAVEQAFEHPGEVGGVDAVHGRAGEAHRVKAEYQCLGMFPRKAMYKVNLSSYSPLAARRGTFDLLDNVRGRAVEVSRFDHLAAALWMYQYLDTWILGTRFGDLLYIEAHMRRAVTFPEDNAGTLYLLIGIIRGHGVLGVPDYHLLLRYAVFERGVPAQVFGGGAEYAPATAEGPFNHGWSFRGGAHNPAVAPAKGFEVIRRAHVCDAANAH